VPVMGKLNFGCGLDQLQLSFHPVGAALERRATTPLAIDIPRKFNETRIVIPQNKPVRGVAPLPDIDHLQGVDYIAFHVIVRTSGRQRLSSCFLFTGSLTSVGVIPGIHDCDSQVEGIHVFWRETFNPRHPYQLARLQ
jgi:hypothetical protein